MKKATQTNSHTCELINSLYFISSNGLPGIEMEFTSCLCLIGSATLGLILLVWGVFELDYSIVGPGYCFSGFDKMVRGGLCASVCVLHGVCVRVCVFSHTTESAETTDSPTGAPSKSLCMQIKNATINVAKEQGGHAGFMAPSTRPPLSPSLSLLLFLPLYVSLSLSFSPSRLPPKPLLGLMWLMGGVGTGDNQTAELSLACSVAAWLCPLCARMCVCA